jgi:hypothetical protein
VAVERGPYAKDRARGTGPASGRAGGRAGGGGGGESGSMRGISHLGRNQFVISLIFVFLFPNFKFI